MSVKRRIFPRLCDVCEKMCFDFDFVVKKIIVQSGIYRYKETQQITACASCINKLDLHNYQVCSVYDWDGELICDMRCDLKRYDKITMLMLGNEYDDACFLHNDYLSRDMFKLIMDITFIKCLRLHTTTLSRTVLKEKRENYKKWMKYKI